MSIISIVYLPEGIAMAADSRLTGNRTITDSNATKSVEKFPISDNAQKIVLLNKCPVGIASFGNGTIGGKTIADYIRVFEINNVEVNDTPENVAEKLKQHANEFTGTVFYVCGYSLDTPYVYTIKENNMNRDNITPTGDIRYSLSWGGETEALNKLINATPIMIRNENLMPLKDGIMV